MSSPRSFPAFSDDAYSFISYLIITTINFIDKFIELTSPDGPTWIGPVKYWVWPILTVSSSRFTLRSLNKLSRSMSSSLICLSATAKVTSNNTYFVRMFIIFWNKQKKTMKWNTTAPNSISHRLRLTARCRLCMDLIKTPESMQQNATASNSTFVSAGSFIEWMDHKCVLC